MGMALSTDTPQKIVTRKIKNILNRLNGIYVSKITKTPKRVLLCPNLFGGVEGHPISDLLVKNMLSALVSVDCYTVPRIAFAPESMFVCTTVDTQ